MIECEVNIHSSSGCGARAFCDSSSLSHIVIAGLVGLKIVSSDLLCFGINVSTDTLSKLRDQPTDWITRRLWDLLLPAVWITQGLDCVLTVAVNVVTRLHAHNFLLLFAL